MRKINKTNEAVLWDSGKFRVDGRGRIWRRLKKGWRRGETKHSKGYLWLSFTDGNCRYRTGAHRLVYHVLKGPITQGLEVNHKNGVKHHNHPNNLELMTGKQNAQHAHRNRLVSQHHRRKLSCAQIKEIKDAYRSGLLLIRELAEIFDVSHHCIGRVINNGYKVDNYGPPAQIKRRLLSQNG